MSCIIKGNSSVIRRLQATFELPSDYSNLLADCLSISSSDVVPRNGSSGDKELRT